MIDAKTQQIVAESLTENSAHDSTVVKKLLSPVKNEIGRFHGDGAYDTDNVRKQLEKRNIHQIIPPREDAVVSKEKRISERDDAIYEINRNGRRAWKERVGYHRRSLVETCMYRLKQTFGEKLKNLKMENQRTEARIRSRLLNIFTKFGLPKSVPLENSA